MSATVLRFDGRVTRKPGAYSKVNADALDSPPAGATGRVLLIGTADGGAPYTEITAETVLRIRNSPALRRAFRGGKLRIAGGLCFKPAKDPRVTSAEEVIMLKVNPDDPAAVTLENGEGDSLTLTSVDYGPHTNQISVEIADGTSVGSKISINFEGTTEVLDNIGGDGLISLEYTEAPSVGWDTMTVQQLTSGVQCLATRTEVGKDGELTTTAIAEGVRAVSSSAADVGQVVTVYGLVGGTPTAVQLTLDGTSLQTDATVFDAGKVFGATLSAECAGTVTISQATGPITLFSITAGDLDKGGVRGVTMWLQGALTAVADAATTSQIFIAGRTATGSTVLEVKSLNGTTPVVSTTTAWKQIDFIGLALVAAARTLTFSGTAAQSTHTVQDTLTKLEDFFNGLQTTVSSTTYGFEAIIGTTRTDFDPADLDLMASATSIDGVAVDLAADLALMVEAINDSSEFVTAEAATDAVGIPSNTVSPVYLSGGALNAADADDWQAAFDLARTIECDIMVPLTADPAIHAMLSEHVDYMAGPGRGERTGIVGIMNAGRTALASKSEIKSQIIALNNRNIRVVAEEIDRYVDGERETLDPYYYAALIAGVEAGTALGRSLTSRIVDVLDIRGHSGWNVLDDAEELLEAGLVFTERTKKGFQVVRDITSAVGSSNPAFTAGEANRIINFVTRELRTDLDDFKGEPGFSGSRAALEGRARRKLKSFVEEEKILRQWQNLVVSIELDRGPVSVDIAPAFAINFVPITINLYDAAVTA